MMWPQKQEETAMIDSLLLDVPYKWLPGVHSIR